jgi:hypothetical protein
VKRRITEKYGSEKKEENAIKREIMRRRTYGIRKGNVKKKGKSGTKEILTCLQR